MFKENDRVVVIKGPYTGETGAFVSYANSQNSISIVKISSGDIYVFTHQLKPGLNVGDYVICEKIPPDKDEFPDFVESMERYIKKIGRITSTDEYINVLYDNNITWGYKETWLTKVNLLWTGLPRGNQ